MYFIHKKQRLRDLTPEEEAGFRAWLKDPEMDAAFPWPEGVPATAKVAYESYARPKRKVERLTIDRPTSAIKALDLSEVPLFVPSEAFFTYSPLLDLLKKA